MDKARPDDDQDANETGDDRQCTPPSDVFSEQRPGKQCDDERREERNRDRLIEAQILDRNEIADGRRDHQKRPDDLKSELLRLEELRHCAWSENRDHQQKLSDETRPHNLRDRHLEMTAEILGVGIQAREERDRSAHQQDCLQTVWHRVLGAVQECFGH